MAPPRALLLPGLIALAPALGGADGCSSNTTMVPMRDGTLLATDVYDLREPGPTVLFRTPYNKDGTSDVAPIYNSLGYAVVAQDVRGRYASEGDFELFMSDGWGEDQDGYDTVEWVASQDFSNGDVCLSGGSALAITTILGAASTPPHLKCGYVLVGSGDLYHQVAFWGGAFREEMVYNWLVALGEEDVLPLIYDNYIYSDFWAPINLPTHYEGVNVPMYSVGGWYDIFSQGNLDLFKGAQEGGGPDGRGRQKLLMGPWSHQSGGGQIGELTFPDNSYLPTTEEARWYERWLLGVENGVDTEPPVTYYLMGDVDTPSADWNVWKTAASWPPPSTATALYLHSGGGASFTPPGEATPSRYLFDPTDPVTSIGGNNLVIPAGPYDQRPVESRDDVLVFSTDRLSQPLTITGRVTARLYVASSAVDTDFTVKLTDVYPDGRSMLLLDGILKMRFREGFEQETMMEPGTIYAVDVDLWSTAHVFNAGHQIRVAVSSSNAPRFSVNMNDGSDPYSGEATAVVAEQTLYHDPLHPSALILPVMGR